MANATLWLIGAILISISLIGILFITFINNDKEKKDMNYFALFIVGLIWVFIGMVIQMAVFWIIGLIFIIIGIMNKNKWKEIKS